jgi:hypothetical protein
MTYGAQLPATVYYPPQFVDQDWKRPDRAAYVAAVAQHRPRMATVLDWERDEQLPEVLAWAEDVAPFVERVILIPKVIGGVPPPAPAHWRARCCTRLLRADALRRYECATVGVCRLAGPPARRVAPPADSDGALPQCCQRRWKLHRQNGAKMESILVTSPGAVREGPPLAAAH